MGQLQEIEPKLVDLGYQIIAVSADRPSKMQETYSKHKFQYKIYSDSSANAAAAFGLAYRVEDDYVSKLKGFGMDLQAASGTPENILPVPAVFIIDPDGTIKFEYVNPTYQIRIHPDVLLAAAKAEKELMEKEKEEQKNQNNSE